MQGRSWACPGDTGGSGAGRQCAHSREALGGQSHGGQGSGSAGDSGLGGDTLTGVIGILEPGRAGLLTARKNYSGEKGRATVTRSAWL